MLSNTHITGGLVFTSLSIFFLKDSNVEINEISFIAMGLIGSIIPDVDHPKSWPTKLIPLPLHKFFKESSSNKFPYDTSFKHRGLTHSIQLISLLICISIITNNFNLHAFNLGIISHIFLDLIYKSTKKLGCEYQVEKFVFYFNWIVIIILTMKI